MSIVNPATDKYQKCIDACTKCAQFCLECMVMCLSEPDVGARINCITMLNECACICKESASFMAMDAKHAMELCKLCETICMECAKECGMFQDEHCKKCSDECNACAKECSMMSK